MFGISFLFMPQSKLSTCFAFACPTATRLYASTPFANGTISIGGGLKTPVFKTRAELVLDFRYLLRSQAVTVYPEQPGEIMIEVDEVESDARASLA